VRTAEEAPVSITVGVVLGLVIVAWLVGLHAGPHVHLAAGILGSLAAAWLLATALTSRSAPVLWGLVAGVLVISALAVVLGVYAMSGRGTVAYHLLDRVEGAEGIAISDLAPRGLVRVRGEQWSAVSVNGIARAGTPVQVIRKSGLHLEVWAEEPEVPAPDHPAIAGS
jgi:membrane protein implicated in regulation of membrane protease activity